MNQEFFWPQYKVKPIFYGGRVQNQDEVQSKFQINITNPMLESITSINSELEEPLKVILSKAGYQQQDFLNPQNNGLFTYLREEAQRNKSKSLINKQQRKTQQVLLSRHSTIMPKKSIVVSQFHFSHSHQVQQIKMQPKFASPDLIEQFKLLQKKQEEIQPNDDEELKQILKPNERNIDYSFSSSLDEEDDEQL